MTTILSSPEDGSTDVEIVYEEVSPQNKLRQELHILEILRDRQEPIPINYKSFKEYVGSLKYHFSPVAINSVWKKLTEITHLEKEGKLGQNFNKHTICGRDNCVCGKDLSDVVVILSGNEEEDVPLSNDVNYTGLNKVPCKEKLLPRNNEMNTNSERTSDESTKQHITDKIYQNSSLISSNRKSLNCSYDNTNNGSHMYNESCTKSKLGFEEELKCSNTKHKSNKKMKNIGSNIENTTEHMNVAEATPHIECFNSHNKNYTFESKVHAEINENVSSQNKRTNSNYNHTVVTNNYEISSSKACKHLIFDSDDGGGKTNGTKNKNQTNTSNISLEKVKTQKRHKNKSKKEKSHSAENTSIAEVNTMDWTDWDLVVSHSEHLWKEKKTEDKTINKSKEGVSNYVQLERKRKKRKNITDDLENRNSSLGHISSKSGEDICNVSVTDGRKMKNYKHENKKEKLTNDIHNKSFEIADKIKTEFSNTNTDNKTVNISKEDVSYYEQPQRRRKKGKNITDDLENRNSSFGLISSKSEEDIYNASLMDGRKMKKYTHENKKEKLTNDFHNNSFEITDKIKTEFLNDNNESVKQKNRKEKKRKQENYLNNTSNSDYKYENEDYNKESENRDQYNRKRTKKLKEKKESSWSKTVTGITKHVCDMVEGEVKTKEDNFYMSKPVHLRHRKRKSSLCNDKLFANDRVVIDAHIQIVHNSESEEQKKNYDSINSRNSCNSSEKKKRSSLDKSDTYGISKGKLKKFMKMHNKEKHKEKEKIVKQEWELIHDRIVDLLVPQSFQEKYKNAT